MTDIFTFPESIMLRDTTLYDDMGGLGQRIYTNAGSGYTKQQYIRADIVEKLRQQLAAADEDNKALSFNSQGTIEKLRKQLQDATTYILNDVRDLKIELAECQAESAKWFKKYMEEANKGCTW